MAGIACQSSSNSIPRNDREELVGSSFNINSRGSLDFDSLNDVDVIVDVTESEPTSIVLSFCQRRFLLPYVNILGVVGLRPITVDSSQCSIWFGHLQTLFVIVLLLIGYLIQSFTGFRRDRGVTTQNVMITFDNYLNESHTTFGETIFVFVVPSLLHFIGFISAVYVLRIADNEQLQNLVERVFILCQLPNRLFLMLWFYISCGLIWLLLMASCIVFVESHSPGITENLKAFRNISPDFQYWISIILIASIIGHDLVQVVVLSSYAIQCYLLRHYLYILNDKLIQNTIEPIDWMREMCEFRKLLHHLNKKTAKPVCFFTVLNITYAIAGFAYLIKTYVESNAPIKMFSMNVGNILLWLVIAFYPFFQGAALTEACMVARTSGHQIRIRPFVHHNTSSEDLNSVLLYSSSLQMSAKLFRMPIQGNYLFCVILILLVVILAMGMCVKVYLGLS
ncbi:uncharacterized protein LOC119078748 isoform X1 [Bradysia coprophila]|uniref:uncharacterized protein LOC119078748 isoform X1 n=1 Tax=Bradysia coprophila TaxID=38358 RepID=UPI00187D974A|nr:uncharacterized protein LOC119078748 isoform X1 [Bradysia coprophila]